jgi:hypothetical protein
MLQGRMEQRGWHSVVDRRQRPGAGWWTKARALVYGDLATDDRRTKLDRSARQLHRHTLAKPDKRLHQRHTDRAARVVLFAPAGGWATHKGEPRKLGHHHL